MCIYIYIHISNNIYIYIFIHTYIHTCIERERDIHITFPYLRFQSLDFEQK